MQPRPSTQLPRAPRRRRRDWTQLAARLVCVVFALVGAVPLGLVALARSPLVNRWAAEASNKALASQGIVASYAIGVSLFPLELEVSHLRVRSKDGGPPALTSDSVRVRPRVFSLLAGKIAIDQIEIDDPTVRLVVKDGKLVNLGIELPKSSGEKKAFHAPFSVFAITSAATDITIDDSHFVSSEVDLDVTTDADSAEGSSFEIAARVGRATFRNLRESTNKAGEAITAYDEDALCSLEARARIEPKAILVRRLNATGAADLDAASDTIPGCDLAQSDKRRVEIALAHVRIDLPEKSGDLPRIDGHLHVRGPVGIAERAASLPETDGWVGVEGDVAYAPDQALPEGTVHVEAHDVKLDRYRFAQELQSDLVIHRNVITSDRTMLRIADGTAILTDVSVEPLAKGVPIKTKLDVTGASFFALMRDLGISAHPHVTWDLKEVHVPSFKGTIVPLKLDGDFTAKTANFAVADKAIDDPTHARILGFREAQIAAHCSVRPAALEFLNVHSTLEHSQIDGASVSIGFHNNLLVDVPKVHADLVDISPLGDIPLGGVADIQAHVSGKFNDPHLEADTLIANFALGDIPFGSVSGAHVIYSGTAVDLRDVKAQKGKSQYGMPQARLEFGSDARMKLDGIAESDALALRDFLAIWKLEDDPRFDDIDASMAMHAAIHMALGGKEDLCGDGFVDVRGELHAKDVKLYGEDFDDGDVDLEYRWFDRRAGLAGADIDVRALTLHKSHVQGKEPVGSILGSARSKRGQLHGSVVLEGIPLYRLQSLGAIRTDTEGSLSGIAKVDGTLDAFKMESDLDVTPVRVRGTALGPSHAHVRLTQLPMPEKLLGHTKCGGNVTATLDREAIVRQSALPQGEITIDGEFLGGQAKLDHVVITRQTAKQVSGAIALRGLDLGSLAQIAMPTAADSDSDAAVAQTGNALDGALTGDLVIRHAALDDLQHAQVEFSPKSLSITRGTQRFTMRPATASIVLANDVLAVPPLVFDLEAGRGLKGAFTLGGQVSRATGSGDLALGIDLAPIDLGLLAGVVPRVDRAAGTLTGNVKVRGRYRSPDVDGELHVRGGELAIKGLPGIVSELEVDVSADASEVRLTHATAKFAGGTVSATGVVPVKSFVMGVAEAKVTGRGLRLTPVEGVSTTIDADLVVSVNPQSNEGPTGRLPRVTGDVVLTQFEYTRPINLATDFNAFGVRAKRTVVDTYDPSLDSLTLDLRVRSRTPIRIKNNLVEVQLGIDSGALSVTGTNQRMGLRGDLKAQPGGRFHLRANEFDIRQAYIRFDDPTRIAPNVDVLAVTEYRRYTDTTAGAAAGGAASGTAATAGGGGGRIWRITLHAYGDADNLRLDMTSDPPLSQEDIVLLLTIGMTRAEVDQLQAGSLGASAALEALATVSGADKAVKEAIPVIDDFRFGSAYSPKTGRTEPQVTVGKRLTDNVRASVTSGLTSDQDRELRSNIEWRLNTQVSVQGSYDNINDVSSSTVGNVGVDLRWRLEFE